jgi:hypothetical protein
MTTTSQKKTEVLDFKKKYLIIANIETLEKTKKAGSVVFPSIFLSNVIESTAYSNGVIPNMLVEVEAAFISQNTYKLKTGEIICTNGEVSSEKIF